ncbi:hypothetical protein MPER_04226 [Moniliophthora perniciosa FA553]|nr:hypothetical protein MPER_04226 [Moniliophthora perniciosa FA553]
MIEAGLIGEQVSIADLHLGAWLARIVKLAGASAADDGNAVIEKVEKHVGGGYTIPRVVLPVDLMRMEGDRPVSRSKLAALWDTLKERQSWKKVYAQGLV